jgi:hypothetical protein
MASRTHNAHGGGKHLLDKKVAATQAEMTISPETLTPEQLERLIEQELLDLAHKAEEETRTKTVLRDKWRTAIFGRCPGGDKVLGAALESAGGQVQCLGQPKSPQPVSLRLGRVLLKPLPCSFLCARQFGWGKKRSSFVAVLDGKLRHRTQVTRRCQV